jgi:hypothetical protein
VWSQQDHLLMLLLHLAHRHTLLQQQLRLQ